MKIKTIIAAALVWPIATALGGALLLSTGPTLESRLMPVLASQFVDDVTRDGTRLCWRWNYFKLRGAKPVSTSWVFRVSGQSVRTAVVFTEEDTDPVSRIMRERPPGPGASNLCTVVPDDIAAVRGVTVAGTINYRTNHTLWTIWHDTPLVAMP